MRLFANRTPTTPDEPVTPAELSRWRKTVETLEECDTQHGGSAAPGTVAARAAYEAAAARNGRRKLP